MSTGECSMSSQVSSSSVTQTNIMTPMMMTCATSWLTKRPAMCYVTSGYWGTVRRPIVTGPCCGAFCACLRIKSRKTCLSPASWLGFGCWFWTAASCMGCGLRSCARVTMGACLGSLTGPVSIDSSYHSSFCETIRIYPPTLSPICYPPPGPHSPLRFSLFLPPRLFRTLPPRPH